MKPKTLKLLVLSSLIVFSIWMTILKGEASSTPADQALLSTGRGSSETLQASYDAWAADFEKNGGEKNIVLPMNACPGLSTEKEGVYGLATLNLTDGRVSVEVRGLPGAEGLDVWLVDNKPGEGRTILPEPGDAMVEVGSLTREGDVAKLDAAFGDGEPEAFEPDLVVITRAGKSPIEERLLTAQTTLFHRLYHSAKRGQFGVLRDSVEPEQCEAPKGILRRVADLISPSAHAQIGPNPNPTTALERLIVQGRNIFFNGTFNGNGRTCGTCHREENNLTIDPKFIATLPPNDPLFVAEFNPALSQNFENPVLLRKFGLILLNVDGFDDLNNKFVMRGVPHTLAMLPDTLKPGELDETHPIGQPPVPPVERLGWSGDGAPVGTFTLADGTVHQATGTLRDFMIGAIIQHYPKTLNRVPGVDFRMPTVAELDSLEAFQKSLGRRENLKLAGAGALRLKSEKAAKGQEIFNNPGSFINPFTGTLLFSQPSKGAGRCILCHFNAGAADFVEGALFGGNNDPGTGTATGNSNFDTGIEDQPNRPQTLVVPSQKIPPDGGFGRDPIFKNGKFLGFGNGSANLPPPIIPADQNKRTFNTPVLVEAADTGPFFHDNSISTIEGAVSFYNSETFNNSPIGQNIRSLDPDGIGIQLEATEIEAVAAFLRVINVLENIRSSVDLESRARSATSFSQAQELLKLSISELDDATRVLEGGDLHPEAQKKLHQAAALDALALATPSGALRNQLIDQAVALKNSARSDMVF
jgi:cytochrome c peroxidase